MSRSIPVLIAILLAVAPLAAQTELPPGFAHQMVFSDLNEPVAARFAPDGRVFVAEKEGRVRVFDGFADADADTLIDLTASANDYFDRGLLGLAVHPAFPTPAYVYVFYTYNHDPLEPSGSVPLWPDAVCPDPPGLSADGCVVNARLSRLEVAADNTLVGAEQVLIEDRWCQQFGSHSAGDLVFGLDGYLYVSAGEGAAWWLTDYGQRGGSPDSPVPPNPCGDPPSGRGGVQLPPAAEGGSLRAQDLRTVGDPVAYSGTLLRIDPLTGAAAPDNPLVGADPKDDAIVAYGLRNPYRIAVHPATGDLFVGDVGWRDWEEINRVDDPTASVPNFGWPCYEGPLPQPSWDALDLDLCENLYADSVAPATAPWLTYRQGTAVDAQPGGVLDCADVSRGSITGLAFNLGTAYPGLFSDVLFFADHARQCLYFAQLDASGAPIASTVDTFGKQIGAVDLQLGPDGSLYYVSPGNGAVYRLAWVEVNDPPSALATSDVVFASPPFDVQLDGTGSSDPDPFDVLVWAWDLDGDGAFDDGTLPAWTWNVATDGTRDVTLRVTDESGLADEMALVVVAASTPPPEPAVVRLDRTWVSWDRVDQATEYDVLRGSLGLLRDGGNLADSITDCYRSSHAQTQALMAAPPSGLGWWVLVRATNPLGAGSWDSPGLNQAVSRDVPINASPAACP